MKSVDDAGETREAAGSERSRWIDAVLLTAATLLVYAGIYNCPFMFDDYVEIVERSGESLGAIVRANPTRAFSYLTFWMNQALGGSLAGYHAVNVALHAVNALLVLGILRVARRLRAPELPGWAPLAGALLWALHPLQTNAVTYLSQRIASLAALCVFGATFCYLRAREARLSDVTSGARRCAGWYTGAFFFACLAAVSKENTAPLPVVLALGEWLLVGSAAPEGIGGRARLLAPFLITPTLLALRVHLVQVQVAAEVARHEWGLGPTGHGYLGNYQGWNFPTRKEYLLTEPGVLWRYLRLWLLPINQVFDPLVIPVTRVTDPRAFVPASGLVALAALALAQARRRPLVAFGVLWFFVTLAVESSIFPIADFMLEHRMLLPSGGLTIAALGLASPALVRHRRAGALIAACLAIALGALTVARNRVWRDPIVFWSDNVSKAPGKLRGWLNLSDGYVRAGRFDLAEEALVRANEVFDRSPEVHSDLGAVRLRMGKMGAAEASLRRALKLNPLEAAAHYNLGTLLARTGRQAQAELEFRWAMRINPEYAPEAHFNLGVLYQQEARLPDAAAELEAAIRAKPDFMEAHANLSGVYRALGRTQDARREMEIAERLRKERAGG
jgi:tetratricopeptide (TPR) repeat protein